MPVVAFDYNGREYKAEVPDSFLALPDNVKSSQITSWLKKEYGLKPKPSKEDKNILDYVALLERPIQAAKVGLKETPIGGEIHQALGGIDITPNEGLLTGIKRGWLGDDEVRTQDYLPDNMNPVAKGILGFVGDVATDPLMWVGPQAVGAVGKGLKAASDTTGLTRAANRGFNKFLDANIGRGRKGADLLRYLNVPTRRGKEVKGVITQHSQTPFAGEVDDFNVMLRPDTQAMLKKVAERNGVPIDEAYRMLRIAFETKPKTIQTNVPLRDSDGNLVTRTLDDGTEETIYRHNIEYIDGVKQYEAYSDEVANFFSPEDLRIFERNRDLLDKAVQFSKAAGQPVPQVMERGYYPRVRTEEARKAEKELMTADERAGLTAEDEMFADGDWVDKIIFGDNYKRERLIKGVPFDRANEIITRDLNMRRQASGLPPIQGKYWMEDPMQAVTARLTSQERAISKKSAIDDLTDSPNLTGSMPHVAGTNPETGAPIYDGWTHFKPERNIGYWFRDVKNSAGEIIAKERRVLNADWVGFRELMKTREGRQIIYRQKAAAGKEWQPPERYLWERMSADEFRAQYANKGWEKVNSIHSSHYNNAQSIVEWERALRREMQIGGLDMAWLDEAIESGITTSDDFLKFINKKLGRETVGPTGRTVNTVPQSSMSTLQRYEAVAKRADDEAQEFLRNNPPAEFYTEDIIARQMDDSMNLIQGQLHRGLKEPVAGFVEGYDKWMNAWKSWSLGVRPAYHTRNVIGNLWNMYAIAGYVPNVMEDLISNAGKLQYYARFGGSEARRLETIANATGAQGVAMKTAAKKYQRINDDEWTAPNFAGTGYSMKEVYGMGRSLGITAGHYSADIVKDFTTQARIASGEGSFFEKFIGKDNPVVKAGFMFGGTIEGNARFGLFIHALKDMRVNPSKYKFHANDGKVFQVNQVPLRDYFKREVEVVDGVGHGYNVPLTSNDVKAQAAADVVKSALFDYADLSTFEQHYMKRIAPFYTWSRKNLPAQVKALVQNPQRAEAVAIAKQQFENDTGDMSKIDFGQFWNDRVPVFFGQENKGVVQAFTLMNLLPMADLQYMITPTRLFGELASPGIKGPIEQLINYNTFSKKAIKEYPGQMKDFMGVALPPRLHYLAELLVPFAEINRLNPANVFGLQRVDPSTGEVVKRHPSIFGVSREQYKDYVWEQRLIRFFTGVPIHDVNLDQTQYFENKQLMQDIAELKGKIKIAGFKGQDRRREEFSNLLQAVLDGKNNDPFNRR